MLGLGRNQNKKQSIFLSATQRKTHGFHMTIFKNFMDYSSSTLRSVLIGTANIEPCFRKFDIP